MAITFPRKWVKLDSKQLYKHVPKSEETSYEGKLTVFWNQQVQTDKTIPDNKPDHHNP